MIFKSSLEMYLLQRWQTLMHLVAVLIRTLPTFLLLLHRGICRRVLLVGAEVDNLCVLASALAFLVPFRRGLWQRAPARSGVKVLQNAIRMRGRLLGLFGLLLASRGSQCACVGA